MAVVLALFEKESGWRHGYELCRLLDLKAGSLYPILVRLAERGMVESVWEDGPPRGRPLRHLYRLTGPGVAMAADLAREATDEARRIRLLPWEGPPSD
jgi:PadR family transcriptional regulator PadR